MITYKSNERLNTETERRWISKTLPSSIFKFNKDHNWITNFCYFEDYGWYLPNGDFKRYRACLDCSKYNLTIKSCKGLTRTWIKIPISYRNYQKYSKGHHKCLILAGNPVINNRVFDIKVLNLVIDDKVDSYFVIETEFLSENEAVQFNIKDYLSDNLIEVTDDPRYEYAYQYSNYYSKDIGQQYDTAQDLHDFICSQYGDTISL